MSTAKEPESWTAPRACSYGLTTSTQASVFLLFVGLHIVDNIMYFVGGIIVLSESTGDRFCEDIYHIKKYVVFSLIVNACAFATYFLFSRASYPECVRARATGLVVLHVALLTWGALTWRQLDPLCSERIGHHLRLLHHATVILNGVYFAFYLFHEALPPMADWTIFPVFCLTPGHNFVTTSFTQGALPDVQHPANRPSLSSGGGLPVSSTYIPSKNGDAVQWQSISPSTISQTMFASSPHAGIPVAKPPFAHTP